MGRGKKEEGSGKKEEGSGKKEVGRGKWEEGEGSGKWDERTSKKTVERDCFVPRNDGRIVSIKNKKTCCFMQ